MGWFSLWKQLCDKIIVKHILLTINEIGTWVEIIKWSQTIIVFQGISQLFFITANVTANLIIKTRFYDCFKREACSINRPYYSNIFNSPDSKSGMAYIFPLRIHMIRGLFNNKIFLGEAYSNIWFLKVTFCTCRRVTCWRQIRWYKNKSKKGQLVLTHCQEKNQFSGQSK